MPLTIDLNCDLGEGFGPYAIGNDEGVLPYVTSANIACGLHAGDPGTMRRTVRLAAEHRVAIGAHPGLPDRVAFGRRRWDLAPQDARDLVTYQVGALWGIARAEGADLQHVKPHGALYNMAATDPALAAAVASAIASIHPHLILFALPGSQLAIQGRTAGLHVCQEAFADRGYERDGTLTPRDLPGAVILGHPPAVAQALQIVQRKSVTTRQGSVIPVDAQTLCVHGDRQDAAEFARALRTALDDAGIRVQSPLTAERTGKT